jgi:hypothetical protein
MGFHGFPWFPLPCAKRQRFNSSKASIHCRPLSQALRAAEQVKVFGRSCLGCVTNPQQDLEVLQIWEEKTETDGNKVEIEMFGKIDVEITGRHSMWKLTLPAETSRDVP